MNKTQGIHSALVAVAALLACTVFAAVTATVTSLAPHRTWGAFAACAYAVAACAALRGLRILARVTALAGAVCAPLALLAVRGSAQEEVHVVHRAAARLLTEGTPYLSAGQLEGADYPAYNPYLPGMALFGIPHQLAGVDARFVFAAFFTVTLALSARLAHGAGQGRRAAILFTASPLIALPLVTGGDDLPVIGLVCLGLALADRDRPGLAGLALGLAGFLKATAWPALAVAPALLAVRAARGGRPSLRTVPRYAAGAALPLVVGLALPALADPGGLVANTVSYPLGLAGVESPAAAPLPGELLADAGPLGHALAVGGLIVAALAVAVSLYARPPGDVRAAALRLAGGLLAAMALMPASRFGYLVYPAVLVLWAYWRNPDAEPAPVPEPGTVPELALGAQHARYVPYFGPHADRHERLPAAPGRHREVRARDGASLPAG